MLRAGGSHFTVYGDLDFYGTSADFEDASEVIKKISTPDQDYEATNKAYVDGVVVPSGGLVAGLQQAQFPLGGQMRGYLHLCQTIWIVKD